MAKNKTRKDGRVQVKKRIDGVDKYFYGKTTKEAKEARDEFLKKYNETALEELLKERERKRNVLISSLADEWLESCENSVSGATYRGYKSKVKRIKKYFEGKTASKTESKDIQKFIDSLRNFSENTVRKYMIYTKAMFTLGHETGKIESNPYIKIRLPICKAPKEPRAYTKEVEIDLLNIAKEAGKKGLPIYIPLKTGMRPGEVIAFNPSRDLDIKKKILTIQETIITEDVGHNVGLPKYGSIRQVPFKVDDDFIDHIMSFGFEGYIYEGRNGLPKTYQNWRKNDFDPFMESLPEEIERLHPHELRHTYGTLLYDGGTDMYTIMKLMGHKSIEVTKIYVRHEVESVRKKIKRNGQGVKRVSVYSAR